MRLAEQDDDAVDANARDEVRARERLQDAATVMRLAEQDDKAVVANAGDNVRSPANHRDTATTMRLAKQDDKPTVTSSDEANLAGPLAHGVDAPKTRHLCRLLRKQVPPPN